MARYRVIRKGQAPREYTEAGYRRFKYIFEREKAIVEVLPDETAEKPKKKGRPKKVVLTDDNLSGQVEKEDDSITTINKDE